jgi:hypothetical protein
MYCWCIWLKKLMLFMSYREGRLNTVAGFSVADDAVAEGLKGFD